MPKRLHTVVETPDYLRDAKRAGMTAVEQERALREYADNPISGEDVVGSGGVRKGRVAGRGKGKSGGYRVVSVYLDEDYPVYLIGVLSKGDRENWTAAEVKEFKKLTTAMKAAKRGRAKR